MAKSHRRRMHPRWQEATTPKRLRRGHLAQSLNEDTARSQAPCSYEVQLLDFKCPRRALALLLVVLVLAAMVVLVLVQVSGTSNGSPRPPPQFVIRQQQHRPHLPSEGSAVECFLRGLQEVVAVHRGPSAAAHDHDVPRGACGALDGPCLLYTSDAADE